MIFDAVSEYVWLDIRSYVELRSFGRGIVTVSDLIRWPRASNGDYPSMTAIPGQTTPLILCCNLGIRTRFYQGLAYRDPQGLEARRPGS